MSFANRHNKPANGATFTFQQIENPEYFKLKDIYGQGVQSAKDAVTVRGVFIVTGGRFGDQGTLVCDGYNVNLPAHMLKEVRDIMASQEDINAINAGAVGFYPYEYTNSRGGTSYSVRWVDLKPVQEELPF